MQRNSETPAVLVSELKLLVIVSAPREICSVLGKVTEVSFNTFRFTSCLIVAVIRPVVKVGLVKGPSRSVKLAAIGVLFSFTLTSPLMGYGVQAAGIPCKLHVVNALGYAKSVGIVTTRESPVPSSKVVFMTFSEKMVCAPFDLLEILWDMDKSFSSEEVTVIVVSI